MNIPYVFKYCKYCNRWLVASTYNFNKAKKGKYRLRSECRNCQKNFNKQWREQNQEQKKEYNKQYRDRNRERLNEYSKQYYKENREQKKEYNKQYKEQNREQIKEYNKQWYEQNKEHCKEYSRQYYKENNEYCKEYSKQHHKQNREYYKERSKKWREQNKEYLKEYRKQIYAQNKEIIKENVKQYNKQNKDARKKYNKQWREQNRKHIKDYYKKYINTPKGQISIFNSCTKRRIKMQNQGDGITKEQWIDCMKFFDWKCAYSGEYLGGNNNQNIRSIDHIIPLNKGGVHEIWNLVPMTRSNNCSKQDKDLLEWYKEQPFFSEERLQKIYEWQEYAYNKWHKEEII